MKVKNESIKELVESVESLTRIAYPEASPGLQDMLGRDHFIDTLPEDVKNLSGATSVIVDISRDCIRIGAPSVSKLHGSSWGERKVDKGISITPSPVNAEDTKFGRLEPMINLLLQ